MKELNILLDYIDSYVYDSESEEIMIKHSPDESKALEVYKRTLIAYSIEKSDLLKWHFDIALDCVRRLSEEDRVHYSQNYDGYSFGYGMFIRNNYIYPSKKHFSNLSPDDQSGAVMELIYTILHKSYNFFTSAEFLQYANVSFYEKNKVLDMCIEDLGLCEKTCICLKMANLNTVEDLILLTESKVMEVVGFEKKCLDELKNKLDGMGLAFCVDEDKHSSYQL